MKIRRLSEIDLARLCTYAAGPSLEQALRNYNTGGGAWSYDPVRASIADILNAKVPLLERMDEVAWPKIARQITSASNRGVEQAAANRLVGKVLFDEARSLGWVAAKFDMARMPIGFGEAVRYWSDVLIDDGHGPIVPFFDHRREHGVTNLDIRRIVFSMQNVWVRDRYPDLADARLAVVRFPSDGDDRSITMDFHVESELLSYEDLNELVRNVYRTWAKVSEVRLETERRKGTGTENPFGF
jgi:hypothetical protein